MPRENKIHIIQKDHWGEAFNLTLLIAAFVTNGLVKLREDAIIFNTEIKSNRPCAVVKAFKFLEICLIQVHKDAHECGGVNLLQVSESMWKKRNYGVFLLIAARSRNLQDLCLRIELLKR